MNASEWFKKQGKAFRNVKSVAELNELVEQCGNMVIRHVDDFDISPSKKHQIRESASPRAAWMVLVSVWEAAGKPRMQQ